MCVVHWRACPCSSVGCIQNLHLLLPWVLKWVLSLPVQWVVHSEVGSELLFSLWGGATGFLKRFGGSSEGSIMQELL